MEVLKYYYISNDSVKLLEIIKVEDKFYLDEELEVEVTFDSDNTSHYASWWEDCEHFTTCEVFTNREEAVSCLRESLMTRIERLKQKLAALE